MGVYVWVLTAGVPAWAEGTPPGARFAALGALAVLSASLMAPRNLLSLVLGVEAFFGLTVVCWWFLREADAPVLPGFFGVLGWVVYTLAWGTLSKPVIASSSEDQEDAPMPRLVPRRPPSRLALLVASPALCLMPLLLFPGLGVDREPARVLSQVVALALLLLLTQAGAHVGAGLQAPDPTRSARHRLRAARTPLLLLCVLAAIAYAWRLAPD